MKRKGNENVGRYLFISEKCNKTPLLNSSSVLIASSMRDSNHSATHGLLTNSSSSIWCPQSNSTIEWLEVDLGAPYIVCGLAAVNDVTVGNRSSVTWYRTFASLSPFQEDPKTVNNSMVSSVRKRCKNYEKSYKQRENQFCTTVFKQNKQNKTKKTKSCQLHPQHVENPLYFGKSKCCSSLKLGISASVVCKTKDTL